jgi:spore coat polysaccharide biosynthesis predicted glycosyltransferase SpsG
MTRFAFRTRASITYGSGHLARTKLLIETLNRKGITPDRISLIVECDKVFADTIRGVPWQLSTLHEGASPSQERLILSQHKAEIVVCDLLAPSSAHLQILKDAFGTLVCFADEGKIDAQADITFCPQLLTSVPQPTSPRQRVFYGPSYFVVDSKVCELRQAKKLRGFETNGLVICLGGSASPEAMKIVRDGIEQLASERFPKISWVTGRTGTGSVIGDLRARLPWVDIVEYDQNLLQRLCNAEIAVTGGGFLKYEAAAVGTPMLILALVDHQSELSRIFCKSGAAEFIGQVGSVSGSILAGAITDLASEKARCKEMTSRGMALLDGSGGSRICDIILGECLGAV